MSAVEQQVFALAQEVKEVQTKLSVYEQMQEAAAKFHQYITSQVATKTAEITTTTSAMHGDTRKIYAELNNHATAYSSLQLGLQDVTAKVNMLIQQSASASSGAQRAMPEK